jgi:hypothetical protein
MSSGVSGTKGTNQRSMSCTLHRGSPMSFLYTLRPPGNYSYVRIVMVLRDNYEARAVEIR